jgi:dipeptidase E
MNLVLYSGGGSRENRRLIQENQRLLEGKKDPLVAFIPSDSEDAESDFLQFQRKFRTTKIRRFLLVPIDQKLTKKKIQALFSADAIYLGGGNTFYFLKTLREKKLLAKLRSFSKKGGVLMGLSAGSILMTPSITTAVVPSMDSDENGVNLKNWQGLNLVPFEFSPHYYFSKAGDQELLDYSKKCDHPIYACKDGEGIVVKNGRLHFIGAVRAFHRGAKMRVQ